MVLICFWSNITCHIHVAGHAKAELLFMDAHSSSLSTALGFLTVVHLQEILLQKQIFITVSGQCVISLNVQKNVMLIFLDTSAVLEPSLNL